MGKYQFSIIMLGDFQIYMNGKLVSEVVCRSKKAKNLLQYLLYFHHLVPAEELFHVFWADTDNPKNALKVLVHRLRTFLIQGGVPENVECIIQRQGGYAWNPALETEIDTERFLACFRDATSGQLDRNHQAQVAALGLSLYKGKFLDEAESWMDAPSAELHQSYLKLVHIMCTFYQEEGQSEELVNLCQQALQYNPLDEAINRELIVGLLACGRSQQALEQYRYVTNAYFDAFGVQVSEELRAVYQYILDAEEASRLDIDSIGEQLEEKTPGAGAFVCEYNIFRELYRIEARCLDRYGGRIYLGLLTISATHREQINDTVLSRQMAVLLEVARNSLRRGDIISQFSESQYVLLLPTVTYESGMMVLDRIRNNFKQQNPRSPIVILGRLRPLRALDSNT